MTTISKDVKKHIPEESVLKHNFNVQTMKVEPRKIIRHDHKVIERTGEPTVLYFRHSPPPVPELHIPPRIQETTPRFNVQIPPTPPPLPYTPRSSPTSEAQVLLIKQSFVDNPENPFITYYGPIRGSFGVVSRHHMRNLPYAGWNVNWVTLKNMTRGQGVASDICIVHPALYWGIKGWRKPSTREHLKNIHKKIVGFEVADSDAISTMVIPIVNELDLLMVPSLAAKTTYLNSGTEIPVKVIPHGLSEAYNTPEKRLPQVPEDGVKVLFFQLHSKWRKGGDVVMEVMKRILTERKDVKFVVKVGGRRELCKLPNTTCFRRWLTEPDLVSLYDSCDILFAPSRGGAFELNVLEAMARGLVIIASSCPCITEYAKEALIIKSKGRVIVLKRNPVHTGFGPDPDPDDAYELLNRAIDNIVELKKKAEALAIETRKNFSWRNTAQKIANVLAEIND